MRDQFPVPAEQCLWRHDSCHFRQHLSSQQPGFDCQTAALIVGEAKPSTAELRTKDSVLLPQILDGVLLLLIHPSGYNKKQKAERVQRLRHRFSSLTPHPWLSSSPPLRLLLSISSSYWTLRDAYADAQRSIRMIRARATEWNVDPARVGFMGFSAGGEIAVLASTKFDAGKPDAADAIKRQSSRPDFQILIYPGIQAEKVEVSKDTPPTFLLCADNDKGPSTAIPAVYLALKKAGVPAELHIYASGGHGFGYQPTDNRLNVIYATWVGRLKDWMADVGMSPAKQKK